MVIPNTVLFMAKEPTIQNIKITGIRTCRGTRRIRREDVWRYIPTHLVQDLLEKYMESDDAIYLFNRLGTKYILTRWAQLYAEFLKAKR